LPGAPKPWRGEGKNGQFGGDRAKAHRGPDHTGIAELRAKLAKRSKSSKASEIRKELIALRVDKDELDWYRAQGARWQTRMNAVLKAYRDATI
jgi:uncharacterized protein (DUF4415 family)